MLFNELTSFVLRAGKTKTEQELAQDFTAAEELFNKKDYINAKKIFKEIALFGSSSTYGRLASVYLSNIDEIIENKEKINKLLKEVERTRDKKELQNLYYEIASLYMAISEYDSATSYFDQAIKVEPKSRLAEKAYFGLGFTKKIQGF